MRNQESAGSDPPAVSPDAASTSSATTKPPRSKVERTIVWAAIVIGLVIVAAEGRSYFAFKRAHRAIQAELQKGAKSNYQITRDQVAALLGNREPDLSKEVDVAGSPNKKYSERYDVYIFKGLIKERTLCVHYGVQGVKDEPEVIEVTSIIPDEIL